MRIFLAFLCSLILLSCAKRPSDVSYFSDVKNCYKVDDSLYRSAQPSRSEMKVLDENGVKTILNLRLLWSDKREAKKTNLVLIHQPINSTKISYHDIVVVMKAIRAAPKPALIHCLHGSDRTGCMIAAYRMVYSGWTKEAAIKEFLDVRFGYHALWFPNILLLLETLDVEQLKRELGNSGQ